MHQKDEIAHLKTETRNPRTKEIDTLSTLEMVRLLQAENRIVNEAVESVLQQVARAVDIITQKMKLGGRLFYIGAGTSGRLGVLDASECPPTFSVSPERFIGLIAGGDTALRSAVENAEDDENAAERQLKEHALTAKDVVCGIAASGRTPYVAGGLAYAREMGAATICVTNNKNSLLGRFSDVAIEVEVGPEALTGSTRLKSGTAQKLVLNMLSTATMIAQGKTYGNLMVDLQASNQKLKLRCVNILRELFPKREENELIAALEQAGGRVKLAAALLHCQKGVKEAQRLLEENDGYLRRILE